MDPYKNNVSFRHYLNKTDFAKQIWYLSEKLAIIIWQKLTIHQLRYTENAKKHYSSKMHRRRSRGTVSFLVDPCKKVSIPLSSLHDKYVIVPADKASNNIVFVCKSYYFKCLIKELGINNNTSSNTTYKPTSFDKDVTFMNFVWKICGIVA
jgi:hypothetical protein